MVRLDELILNCRQGQWKFGCEKLMGDPSDSLFCPPAIERLKAVTPEHDFTVECADNRWHLIQGMREYFELVPF